MSDTRNPTPRFWLVCPGCGSQHEPEARWFGCDTCRDPAGHPHWLEVRFDLSRVDPAFLTKRGRVWDYAPLLPVLYAAVGALLFSGVLPWLRHRPISIRQSVSALIPRLGRLCQRRLCLKDRRSPHRPNARQDSGARRESR